MFQPEVIYEDKNFLVVNKPAGLLVHGAKASSVPEKKSKISHGAGKCQASSGRRELTLVDWLVKNYPEVKTVGDDPETRPGIVHRLDRETSGVMVVARNQENFNYLKKLFGEQRIKKTYLALVYGVLKEKRGLIDKPIGIKSGTTKRSVFSSKLSKEAVTEYKLVSSIPPSQKLRWAGKYQVSSYKKNQKQGTDEGFSLLEVYPRTGRTHQIRVHLASIGHPVVNDGLYASKKKKVGSGRLMLHAWALEFSDMGGGRVRFEAERPEELSTIVLRAV